MVIVNPNPITLAVADKYWVVKCTVMQDMIAAVLAPWDGQYVVGNRSVQRDLRIPDTQAVSAAVFARVATMSGKSHIKVVDVDASDPLAPVKVVAVYDSGETKVVNGTSVPVMATYEIADLFAAAAVDAGLAAVYQTVMVAIAEAVQ
jgi:hypothetical protein